MLLVIAGGSGVFILADKSNPGDLLYSMDRSMESMLLNVTNLLGKSWYGKANLALANERLDEISYLTKKTGNTSFVFKSYAQTDQADTELIRGLINDFNQNIKEALNAFQATEGTGGQEVEFAKEIAKKTTEFSNKLVELLPEVEDDYDTELEETATILEDLDDDATEKLVQESEDDENDDDSLKTMGVEKVTKTILKATEKLAELKKDVEKKDAKEKLTPESLVNLQASILVIESKLEQAKASLSAGNLGEAYALAKEAKDLVSKSRDEFDNEKEDKEDGEDQKDDENDDSKDEDSKDDKEDDDKGTKGSGGSSTKGNSGSDSSKDDNEDDSNSGSGSDDEQDDETDNEEGDNSGNDEEVEGVSDSVSKLWINLVF